MILTSQRHINKTMIYLSRKYFDVIFFRRQITGGETIQSYNHQQVRKDESLQNSHSSDVTGDDDNIDVVNDDDKDSGKYSLIMWLSGLQQKVSNVKIIVSLPPG